MNSLICGRARTCASRAFFVGVDGDGQAVADLAVDLDRQFDFIDDEGRLVDFRPGFLVDAAFKAAFLPEFFRNMRCEGSQELEQVLVGFQGNGLVDGLVGTDIGIHGVDIFHDRADSRIEAVVAVCARTSSVTLAMALNSWKRSSFSASV